jgi:hypothetical protein
LHIRESANTHITLLGSLLALSNALFGGLLSSRLDLLISEQSEAESAIQLTLEKDVLTLDQRMFVLDH